MKKTIGITLGFDFHPSDGYPDPYLMDYVPRAISQAVIQAGGIPLLVPVAPDDVMADYAQLIDGLILSGGSDVSPSLYQQEAHYKLTATEPERDQAEAKLIHEILALGKPILGICRGLQIINSVLGGSLYQDLSLNPQVQVKHSQDSSMWYPIHKVQVTKGSYLEGICQTDQLAVNSLHHQAINQLGSGLRASAYSSDGLIEALESTAGENPQVLAVQWHPEDLYQQDPKHLTLFQDLIKRA
ncbi:gamma-glutamyl-gamma-aminobutyrate hydrolase family protein [Hutsoniella sourekii]